jgi:hypothetical protein
MTICSLCGKKEVMPFTCKFCGNKYCGDHRLPENHECIGLQKFKEERSREPEKWIYEPFHTKYKEAPVGRKASRPLLERLTEALKTRTLIYVILGIIFLVLVLSFAGLF